MRKPCSLSLRSRPRWSHDFDVSEVAARRTQQGTRQEAGPYRKQAGGEQTVSAMWPAPRPSRVRGCCAREGVGLAVNFAKDEVHSSNDGYSVSKHVPPYQLV